MRSYGTGREQVAQMLMWGVWDCYQKKTSGEVPLRVDSLYCSREHWGRGVTKTFIYMDIHPSTASYVKGKERKTRDLLVHRNWVGDVDVNGIVFSSVQSLSHVRILQPHESQQARPPCPSSTPGVYSNSCPLSWWWHPTISSSVIPFSSCPQSLQASGSSPMSQLFAWGGQSIGVSASASVLPMNTQDWSPLGQTNWISLQSKGLSRVFSNTTVQKHQIFSTQLSL